MTGPRLTPQLARSLVEAAVTAPSLHNTQPWRFIARPGEAVIELYADPARMLRRADPQGRAVHLSCGAALFNLRLAATCAAAEPVIRLLPQAAEPQLLATVRLARPCRPQARDLDLYAAIWRRHTTRAPFTPVPVPAPVLAALREAAALEGAALIPLDHAAGQRMIDLATAAQQRLGYDQAARAELSGWARGGRYRDGIPPQSLWPPPWPGGAAGQEAGPLLLHPAQLDPAPQLAVLATHGNRRADWLRAGQALQRVLLLATHHGLATCPLGWVADAREATGGREATLDGQHIQMVLRIGYGPPGPATPRRPVRDVLQIVRELAAGPGALLAVGR
jgi:nitroreductase